MLRQAGLRRGMGAATPACAVYIATAAHCPCMMPVTIVTFCLQVILCIFNYVLLGLSLMRQRSKRSQGGAAAKTGKPAVAAPGGRERPEIQPELIQAKHVGGSPLRLRARGL